MYRRYRRLVKAAQSQLQLLQLALLGFDVKSAPLVLESGQKRIDRIGRFCKQSTGLAQSGMNTSSELLRCGVGVGNNKDFAGAPTGEHLTQVKIGNGMGLARSGTGFDQVAAIKIQ